MLECGVYHLQHANSMEVAMNANSPSHVGQSILEEKDFRRWDKHIVLYGEEKLKRDHPVAAFLAKDNHAKSVNVYPDGCAAEKGIVGSADIFCM